MWDQPLLFLILCSLQITLLMLNMRLKIFLIAALDLVILSSWSSGWATLFLKVLGNLLHTWSAHLVS